MPCGFHTVFVKPGKMRLLYGLFVPRAGVVPRVHGMPYGAAYVPRVECGRGDLFACVGVVCMASDVPGDIIPGLMASDGLRGFYGACTGRGGCLISGRTYPGIM